MQCSQSLSEVLEAGCKLGNLYICSSHTYNTAAVLHVMTMGIPHRCTWMPFGSIVQSTASIRLSLESCGL